MWSLHINAVEWLTATLCHENSMIWKKTVIFFMSVWVCRSTPFSRLDCFLYRNTMLWAHSWVWLKPSPTPAVTFCDRIYFTAQGRGVGVSIGQHSAQCWRVHSELFLSVCFHDFLRIHGSTVGLSGLCVCAIGRDSKSDTDYTLCWHVL